MLQQFTVGAVVAAAVIAAGCGFGTLPAFAQISPGPASPQVYFDLGIDASQLPQDPVAARKYFAAQPPETQKVLLAACRNYVNHPVDAAMPETLVFCKAVVGGLG
jgi:hypothetical protein